ncbi:aminotransferase class IV family protein [Nitratireductor sp. XY-223]|uniref:aminotransferase class IV family protein n=1 Tax=Nitratireductor sp. XY-223 TaxID=2561926 RepID=UPI001FF01600|nr:aminotransferase class IV family protein [Nitratireductor sp. XY-223]
MTGLGAPGLIETMRLREDGTIDRLPLHLDRLERSAAALGVPYDRHKVAAAVDDLRPRGQDQRIRLELAPDGGLGIETRPCPPADPCTPWRIAVAETRLQSTDGLLRHKTTCRNTYLRARQEFPAGEIDEVLLCNERGELCEGTITSLFLQMPDTEALRTPDLSCGLLRGVLRQELLDTGKACEAVLTPADLRSAAQIFVGNSLRGLIPAALP